MQGKSFWCVVACAYDHGGICTRGYVGFTVTGQNTAFIMDQSLFSLDWR